MRIDIDQDWHLTQDADGNVIITRPNVMGKVCTHTIPKSGYTIWDYGVWLWQVRNNQPRPMVQDRFSQLDPKDAEFLLSGITPKDWDKFFPKGDE